MSKKARLKSYLSKVPDDKMSPPHEGWVQVIKASDEDCTSNL